MNYAKTLVLGLCVLLVPVGYCSYEIERYNTGSLVGESEYAGHITVDFTLDAQYTGPAVRIPEILAMKYPGGIKYGASTDCTITSGGTDDQGEPLRWDFRNGRMALLTNTGSISGTRVRCVARTRGGGNRWVLWYYGSYTDERLVYRAYWEDSSGASGSTGTLSITGSGQTTLLGQIPQIATKGRATYTTAASVRVRSTNGKTERVPVIRINEDSTTHVNVLKYTIPSQLEGVTLINEVGRSCATIAPGERCYLLVPPAPTGQTISGNYVFGIAIP